MFGYKHSEGRGRLPEPGAAVLFVCVVRLPWQQRDQRLSLRLDFGQMDRCSVHTLCVMLDMTVSSVFDFVIRYLVLFNHSFTTVFLEVTVVTVAQVYERQHRQVQRT